MGRRKGQDRSFAQRWANCCSAFSTARRSEQQRGRHYVAIPCHATPSSSPVSKAGASAAPSSTCCMSSCAAAGVHYTASLGASALQRGRASGYLARDPIAVGTREGVVSRGRDTGTDVHSGFGDMFTPPSGKKSNWYHTTFAYQYTIPVQKESKKGQIPV